MWQKKVDIGFAASLAVTSAAIFAVVKSTEFALQHAPVSDAIGNVYLNGFLLFSSAFVFCQEIRDLYGPADALSGRQLILRACACGLCGALEGIVVWTHARSLLVGSPGVPELVFDVLVFATTLCTIAFLYISSEDELTITDLFSSGEKYSFLIRSFQDDELASWWDRLPLWHIPHGISFETLVVSACSGKSPPLVALTKQRPRKSVGAWRVRLETGEDWRAVANALLGKATATVLILGSTPGLAEELKGWISLNADERTPLLVFFPPVPPDQLRLRWAALLGLFPPSFLRSVTGLEIPVAKVAVALILPNGALSWETGWKIRWSCWRRKVGRLLRKSGVNLV